MTNTSRLAPPEPAAPPEPRRWRWLPFGDHSRPRRLGKVLAWLVGIALGLVILDVLGVDVRGWLSDLWDALSEIGLGYLLAGWTLHTFQTTLPHSGGTSSCAPPTRAGASGTSRCWPPTPSDPR
jgi:hypothetical protein